MDAFLTDGDEIEFTPGPGWLWHEFDGVVAARPTRKRPWRVLSKQVLVKADLESLARRLEDKEYVTLAHPEAGKVAKARVIVDPTTLARPCHLLGDVPAVRATEGTFQVQCMPAARNTLAGEVDKQTVKSGTWKVKSAQQSQARSVREATKSGASSKAPPREKVRRGEYYVVVQGDTTASIAAQVGIAAETIWQDAKNADLRRLRENQPNILYPGDRVYVSDTQEEAFETTTLKLRFLKNFKPRGKLKYTIEVPELPEPLNGTTDDDGNTEQHEVPATAQSGTLTLHVTGPDGSRRDEVYEVLIGHLDPALEKHGAVDRLTNLGFLSGEGGKDPPAGVFQDALRACRRHFRLAEEGAGIDSEIQGKLRSEHGC